MEIDIKTLTFDKAVELIYKKKLIILHDCHPDSLDSLITICKEIWPKELSPSGGWKYHFQDKHNPNAYNYSNNDLEIVSGCYGVSKNEISISDLYKLYLNKEIQTLQF